MDERAELQRIERLYTLGILDTKEDLTLRNFAEQALSVVPGASFAAVSLVDRQRQWFQTVIGMDVRETPREVSFCAHTIETAGVMVVEDASKDDRFAGNPLVTQLPGIRFYAGIKLINGIGALCVIGKQPRTTTQAEIRKLTQLAQLVDIQLLAHGSLFNLGAAPKRKAASVAAR